MSGGTKPPDPHQIPLYVADQQLQLPSQVAGQPAWAGPRALRGTPNNRTFQQIIEEEKKNRNKPEDSQESQSETTKSQRGPHVLTDTDS